MFLSQKLPKSLHVELESMTKDNKKPYYRYPYKWYKTPIQCNICLMRSGDNHGKILFCKFSLFLISPVKVLQLLFQLPSVNVTACNFC